MKIVEKRLKNMKTGFTLIELLAVIVILAIIALIAVPIVLNIIDESKKNAGLRSAEMYLNAVEMSIATATLDDKNIESKTYGIMSDGNICLETLTAGKCINEKKENRINHEEDILKVEVNGSTPESGTITVAGGSISAIELNYKDGKTIVKNSDGDLVYQDAPAEPTLASCELKSGTEKSIGAKYECDFGDGKRKFYILELGRNKVEGSLLKDDEVALILEGNYDTTTQAWCDHEGANPSDNVCNADGLTPKLNEIREAWKSKLKAEQIVLPSALQIIVANYPSKNTIEYTSGIQSWLYSWDNSVWGDTVYGYWTSSPSADSSDYAWYVSYNGSVSDGHVDSGDYCGVRPVVNLKI